ncbi:MAG: class B sortase [Eubacteriales bacterium]|nr:class B sortase [Lachnospiraceae bacterium]MCI1333659.1 class B sortase [Lachnospiraceae bacterium]MCI1357929.1 class B sortase [Lachnospiraceae bacterium]MCI1377872.1 class B sortase [Lachnospiraceae bacterium]MDD5860290.1 class B sortase [Eubacteriales bacterium]
MDKQKKKKRSVLSIVIIIAALCVFCYSGVRLYGILHVYKEAKDEYAGLADSYTKPVTDGSASGTSSASSAAASSAANADAAGADPAVPLIEDAEPPLTVDWTSLGAVNPDIIGWLYVDGEPSISYPICQTTDNNYYLHHTFRKQSLFAGSIFADYHNSPDFTDADTIVYGHNMKNGSMFGMLKFLDDQSAYEKHPYFWILTPGGNYRYHIFSIFHPSVDSEVYTIYPDGGAEFLAWEQDMQKSSEVENSVPLTENDHTVVLSTCTSDASRRCVVIGKCVSTEQPG